MSDVALSATCPDPYLSDDAVRSLSCGSGMIALPLAHGADFSFLVSNDQKHHISCPRAIPNTQDILRVFILHDIVLSATCPNPSFQGSQI